MISLTHSCLHSSCNIFNYLEAIQGTLGTTNNNGLQNSGLEVMHVLGFQSHFKTGCFRDTAQIKEGCP